MRLHQAGIANVVALMGSSMSMEQEHLLTMHLKTVIVAVDGDDAERAAGPDIVTRLARRCFVRTVELPEGRQPDNLVDDEVRTIFQSYKTRALCMRGSCCSVVVRFSSLANTTHADHNAGTVRVLLRPQIW